MAAANEFEIASLSAFAARVEKLLEQTRKKTPGKPAAMNWYRGHSSSNSYKLLPGLYRHPKIHDIKALLILEESMMSEFRRQGMLHSFQQTTTDTSGRTMLLFYMQHHGVPTRLLDWSSNPFIALYFALASAKRNDDGTCKGPAAVWVFDPYRWNRFALAELDWKDGGPANSEDQRIKSYLPQPIDPSQPVSRYPFPIALTGAVNTPRMMAQKGNFAIFSDDSRPMEDIYDASGFPENSLVKLVVPAEKIDPVLNVLLAVGYTDSVAYPDLQGLAMEIKRLHGFGA